MKRALIPVLLAAVFLPVASAAQPQVTPAKVENRCLQAVNWLLQHQQPNGGWKFREHTSSMDTGVVLLGYSEVYDYLPPSTQAKVKESIIKAVKYIESCYDPEKGGFKDYPDQTDVKYMPMYTIHALIGLIAVEKKFPSIAEQLNVDKYITSGLNYLMKLQKPTGIWDDFGPGSWANQYRDTPWTVWVALWSGKYSPSDPHISKAIEWLLNNLRPVVTPMGEISGMKLDEDAAIKVDMTAMTALALYYAGPKKYEQYIKALQKGLITYQRPDGNFPAHLSFTDEMFGPHGKAVPCPHKTARVLYALMVTGYNPKDEHILKAVAALLDSKAQKDGAWYWPAENNAAEPNPDVGPAYAYCTGWCLAALGAWLHAIGAKPMVSTKAAPAPTGNLVLGALVFDVVPVVLGLSVMGVLPGLGDLEVNGTPVKDINDPVLKFGWFVNAIVNPIAASIMPSEPNTAAGLAAGTFLAPIADLAARMAGMSSNAEEIGIGVAAGLTLLGLLADNGVQAVEAIITPITNTIETLYTTLANLL